MKSVPSRFIGCRRQLGRASRDGGLNFGDGGGGFDRPDVVSGPVAQAQEMQVVVDESGDRGSAAEVDMPVAVVTAHAIAHRDDPVAANTYLGLYGIVGIHRQEPPVRQHEVAADGAPFIAAGACRLRGAYAGHE